MTEAVAGRQKVRVGRALDHDRFAREPKIMATKSRKARGETRGGDDERGGDGKVLKRGPMRVNEEGTSWPQQHRYKAITRTKTSSHVTRLATGIVETSVDSGSH